jgi:hypothetical protein
MKPARQLLTVSFVLLFSACTKDSIDIGDISGVGGTTSVEGASGGVTTDPVGNGGMSGDGTGGAAAVPGSGGAIPADAGSGGATTAPLGTGGSSNDGLGGAGVVPGSGGAGGATTTAVRTGGTISPGTGGAGGLGIGGVGGLGSGGVGGLGSGGVGGAAGVPGTGSSCSGSDIVARDSNNYTIATSLRLASVKVKPLADLTFDWSGVTADLGGRAVAPATDIAMVYVMAFALSLNGLQNKLNTDTLASRDLLLVPPPAFYPKGGMLAAKLSEFTLNGTPIGGGLIDLATILEFFDPAKYPPESTSYLMMASAGTISFQDVFMMQAFQLDTASSNTTVTMGPNSTNMSFSADLHSLTPVGVPTGQATLTLDFGRAISRTGSGGGWDPSMITSAFIGHYPQNLSELEAGIFKLDLIATDYFWTDITGGTTVDFAALKTAAGKRFTGIDATGTWLLGLPCDSGCTNRAPWFVTVLKPCGTP